MNPLSPTGINVASQPFRRERAQNAALALICIVLLCSLLAMIGLILHTRRQASDLRRDIQAARAELRSLGRTQAKFSGVLARPENAEVFSRSAFFNQLIARRAVSWTRVFQDLETVLPSNMRLVTIRLPQVPAEDASGVNHVQLDMTVGADQPATFIELLNRLQQSQLFGAVKVVTQQPPTQNDPLYRYRITVAYAQKL